MDLSQALLLNVEWTFRSRQLVMQPNWIQYLSVCICIAIHIVHFAYDISAPVLVYMLCLVYSTGSPFSRRCCDCVPVSLVM